MISNETDITKPDCKCPVGFTDGVVMNADGQIECVDVDECADHTHACSSIGQCENTEVMRFPTLSETIVEILLRIYQKKRYQKPNKVHMCALVPSIISAMD